jgi:Pyridoxamine 5'-phosphate oxidase
MPEPPLPPDLVAFLAEPNPSVIATIRPDGSPHTAATWYLWVDGRVLVNMDEGRRRLEHLRHEPRVSLTVLGREDWYHHVTLVLGMDTDHRTAPIRARGLPSPPSGRRDGNRRSACRHRRPRTRSARNETRASMR